MKIAVIGYGRRIRNVIRELIVQDPTLELAAIVDVQNEAIKQAMTEREDRLPEFYDTFAEMKERVKPDGVLIGTRCSLHARLAAEVLSSGIPLFLEKPVATTLEDLKLLKQAYDRYPAEVVVSFPLRVTPMVSLVKEILDSGKIGTVEHVQAVNNVPYGGVYYHHWYRDENETGGLFLQKATHDFDYLQHLIGGHPTDVCAMVSKQIFRGDKPAGLKCADCEEKLTCKESTYGVVRSEDTTPAGEYCAFAVDTGNEDSGSALIRYESGMHVSYSQNFFARRKAASRGARLLGYKGTLEFDFYTDEIKVFPHHSPHTEVYRMDGSEAHFGGDQVLADNFLKVMRGEARSSSDMNSGLLSALVCLKARESSLTGTFQTVDWR
ncbi:Gfo/Idh/MocA family oxidoreductase [Paenibacillus aurantius]|uniref:Gfo/Idh/MocA family oxidoreductase n=1 Tax=Paenibacillus aurantius TaxID=2918900 RepID=A0AA96LF11_9BACL|nr:Gfo/Idh/MocA family oxidoreductase [Paenibacillus aurantius]WNQ10880.1 Gfo/Idh/MocA family oxidoreductase [Paenibacillus aurantius]